MGIGADGKPCATALLLRDDLAATVLGEERGGWLNPFDLPTDVPESEALGHITECLRDNARWGSEDDPFPYAKRSGWGRIPDGLTALEQCSFVWHLATKPIAYAGMRPAAGCVFEAYAAFHLWDAPVVWDYYTPETKPELLKYAWAEHCDVWFDPDWTMGFVDKCRNLYAHYIGANLAAERNQSYDQCAQYRGSAAWEEWFRRGGACKHRYQLVILATELFMHREARDLGHLPAEGIVDYMRPLPHDWGVRC